MAEAKTPHGDNEERSEAKSRNIPIDGPGDDAQENKDADATAKKASERSSVVEEAEEILASEEAAEDAGDGKDADETGEGSENGTQKASEGDPLAEAQAQAAEWQDKFMRLHAEWDTYRRRMNEQRETEKARAAEGLVSSLIPVLDDFERTIAYASENGTKGLLEGVEAVHAKLIDVFASQGVEVINPEGEAFDALEAQAVATVEDTEVPEETVNEVYQKGYRMGSKVLRPAMVTVTTGGPKRESPQEEEDETEE
ncbi:MAG: nucleotide exchange factor GrpE [Eggerthellaceae bacterium]|jgi:molecular chaperone GrpE